LAACPNECEGVTPSGVEGRAACPEFVEGESMEGVRKGSSQIV